MKINTKSPWTRVATGFLIFFCGAFAGWILHTAKAPNSGFYNIREKTSYKFISPLLLSGITDKEEFPEYKALSKAMDDYIGKTVSAGKASNVSVYFRDLNSGQWTGINENEKYSPASMLKIAVLIAYLKDLESDPSLPSRQVHILPQSANLDLSQDYFPSEHPVDVGGTYTNQDLVSLMIKESNNNAAAAIDQEIGTDAIKKICSDLQLPVNSVSGLADYISPKLYSRFFRVLYNSTLLPHALSEETLDLLSQTTFDKGLVAGLPASTTVSHKFGERTNTDSAGNVVDRELHDCGIVYYPDHPYFLCVMTRGSDFDNLAGVIKDLSGITWGYAKLIDEKN